MSGQPDANAPPILMVNDDPEILSLSRLILARAGLNNVITALDGQAGLDICHTQPVALVVLDTMMPGMAGLDVLKKLYADPAMRHIPVIIVTADRNPKTIAAAYDLRASDYVMLPCHPNELTDAVRRVLTNTAG